jgi:toxin ParE1/3/4
MAALTIRRTRQAIADVDHIYDFIAANNVAAARAMVDRIDRAINSLIAHPRLGRASRIPGSRELVVSSAPYIVAYRLRGRIVELLAMPPAAGRTDSDLTVDRDLAVGLRRRD